MQHFSIHFNLPPYFVPLLRNPQCKPPPTPSPVKTHLSLAHSRRHTRSERQVSPSPSASSIAESRNSSPSDPSFTEPIDSSPTPHDIHHTIFLLQHLLRLSVPHIITNILDQAEHWHQVGAQCREKAYVSEHSLPDPYPLGVNVSGVGPAPVRKIVFTIESHDQGWSSTDDGGSWTWFDVVAQSTGPGTQPGTGTEPRVFERLHTNVPASSEARRVVIEMRRSEEGSEDADARRRAEWVRGLRDGDVVSLVPKAQFGGWTNHVLFARIVVYTTWYL
ncbi:hypothetical protein MMC16_001167 [Acarospora aff. strigata]|nr:hypothetical protein [Acarospora aff. strigata]